jgi:hypothetical protein
MKLLQKSLQLYELAYQLHVDEQQQRDEQDDQDFHQYGSLRFTMIISNNLSEIHRVAKNPNKHAMCLQHLLSTIMFVVDGQYIGSGGGITSSSLSTSMSEELDGFFRNTSAIMAHDICARAA